MTGAPKTTVRRGTCKRCGRNNLRLYPSTDFLGSHMSWMCSPCRRPYNGSGTPDSYREARDRIMALRTRLDAWIREIEACMGNGKAPCTGEPQ